MAKHISEWLNAYLDGELNRARTSQVEDHLAECAECRAELEELRGLSTLLHETAPTGEFLSTERFVSNLTLNLPRQPEHSQRRKILEVGWWLIPVGTLGIWLFLQVTFTLSALVLRASDAGLLGNTFAMVSRNSVQTGWFASLTNWFGYQPVSALSMLNNAELFVHNLIVPFILQAFLAVIYLIWLASWWLRQQKQSSSGIVESPS
jgi:predicted anti-sigma-YlaC factor YlaD